MKKAIFILPVLLACSVFAVQTNKQTINLGTDVTGTIGLPLPGGDTSYVQVSNNLQAASTFYISSGTVNGQFKSGSLLVNGVNVSSPILNQNSLQSGASYHVASATVDAVLIVGSMTSYGTVTSTSGFVGPGPSLTNLSAANINGSNLPGGSSSYIQQGNTLQSGSSFYVAQASATLILGSSATVGGLGGFVTISTFGVIASNRPCISGFSRISSNECVDNTGAPALLISSSPTGNSTVFLTTQVVNLQNTYSCAVKLAVYLDVIAGGGGAETVNFYTRPQGTSIAATAASLRQSCPATTSVECSDIAHITQLLNSSAQFDYVCRNSGSLTANAQCFIYVEGYKECF